jgi:hypothetical protein
MKILFSLLFLFSFSVRAACRFSPQVNSVYSLSGPMSALIEDLGLMSSPAMKGVTVFYPELKNFKGEIVPGGVYLAPAKLEAMNNSLVFFDTSTELKKLFKTKKINAVEVNTRGLSPREVTTALWEMLKNQVQDCQTESSKMFERVETLEKKIRKEMNPPMSVVVFLGKVGEGKLPELVIANDGIVKWLRGNKLIETYPSELAYVNWAASVMNELKEHLLLGFVEAKSPMLTGKDKRVTLSYPGALIPGMRQLEAWNYFLENRGAHK